MFCSDLDFSPCTKQTLIFFSQIKYIDVCFGICPLLPIDFNYFLTAFECLCSFLFYAYSQKNNFFSKWFCLQWSSKTYHCAFYFFALNCLSVFLFVFAALFILVEKLSLQLDKKAGMYFRNGSVVYSRDAPVQGCMMASSDHCGLW